MIRKEREPKTILLTFDYELFMNKSGTPERCLITPVDELLRLCAGLGIKATFFLDILYYLRLAESPATREQQKKIKFQCQQLIDKGHRLELHLHPHWLDAVWGAGQWTFPSYRNYRLQALPADRVIELFISSTQAIETIAGEVTNGYKVKAFRAGGWCVRPFEKLRAGFAAAGLEIDSSVARNLVISSETHAIDFRAVPDQPWYRFSADPACADPGGDLLEIPISVFRRNFADKLEQKAHFILAGRERTAVFGDGTTMVTAGAKGRWGRRFRADQLMFSLERIPAAVVVKKVEEYRHNSLVFISHPKGMARESLNAIEALARQGHHFATLVDFAQKTDWMREPR